MREIFVHLISDSTAETIQVLSKAIFSQFEDIKIKEYTWSLIRTKGQIEKIKKQILDKKGIVLFTVAENELKLYLHQFCQENNIFCLEVLEEITAKMANYLGINPTPRIGKQHATDEDYFRRIDAMNFTIAHDDGQFTENLYQADIILFGPSRTSKSPTSMYLALKGFKTANIPIVENIPIDETILANKNIFFVGLTICPKRLVEIRKNRLLTIKEQASTDYIDYEVVKQEVINAKKFCLKNKISLIDVTRRSVEETAALIIQMYYAHK